MSGRLLSGSELFSSMPPVDAGLPQRGGQKHYCPEDTWLQEKQLQLFRRERRDVLLEERIGKDGSLNKGEWRPEIEEVELLKERGKVWEHIGHVHQGKKLLFPEEAMFLVDQGQMELQYGEVTLSVQEAYSTLLAGRVPLFHYQVYGHLSRAGYILRRHDKDLIFTGYEKKLKLDQNRSTSRKNRKRRRGKNADEGAEGDSAHHDLKWTKMESEIREGQEDIQLHADVDNGASNAKDINPSLDAWIQKDPKSDKCRTDANTTKSGTESIRTNGSPVPYSAWNFDGDICFPNFNTQSGELKLNRPANNYLPTGTAWPSTKTIKEENNTKDGIVLKFPLKSNFMPKSYEEALEYSHGGTLWKKSTKARNWKEFKREQQQKLKDNGVGLSPAAHLWQDTVAPLVKPEEATSTSNVLDNIKIIRNIHLSSQCRSSDTNSEGEDIIYDIYLPNKKFRKSDPGPPHFRTCIVSAKDEFPSPGRLFGAMKKCVDCVPLLWAIVDNGDIAFYCFHDVDIPGDISGR